MQAENAIIAMAEMHIPGPTYLPLNNPHISLHQLNTARDTLIQESRISIADVEQAIDEYLTKPERNIADIRDIPEMLYSVTGALRFLQQPVPARMLGQLAKYIEQHVASSENIEDNALTCIATVMMAVDHHLHGFEQNRPASKQALDHRPTGLE